MISTQPNLYDKTASTGRQANAQGAITVDGLVAATYANLTRKKPRAGITLDLVKSVLESGDVAVVMREDESVPAPRTLRVLRVYIEGTKALPTTSEPDTFVYDRSLRPGLNGWLGDNDSGKSTILKAIRWALTGSDTFLHMKGDVLSWIRNVAVEFDVDGSRYTIQYWPRDAAPKVSGAIYAEPLDRVLAGGEDLSIRHRLLTLPR
ncbi:MAG: AAA family ATPase [Chloroflexota bacterium]|nr:AAA family ATPase [Chloroflexota bacterium]